MGIVSAALGKWLRLMDGKGLGMAGAWFREGEQREPDFSDTESTFMSSPECESLIRAMVSQNSL